MAVVAIATRPAHAQADYTPPAIGHVFIVMLENEDEATSFGPSSPASYLSKTLPSMGLMLPNYYGTGHESLDNYISLISGQGPNPTTQSDCQTYTDVTPGTIGADGQASGMGCVYPATVSTVANQLAAKGLTWKGYMEDMGNSTTESKTCRHPALNSSDDTQSAHAGDEYAARHNPFVYFHSIIDSPMCNADDVPYDRLAGDLQSVATTPNYTFITPNLCDDGHDSPCVDGRPGGLTSADQFLRGLIPQILASPAYQQDGLLIVAFDESHSGADACCGEQAANTPSAGGPTPGPGGGKVGAVLLSRFIAPGTVDQTPYNHYSLLRSVENIFGLAHLGYAGASGLAAFGADVYNAPAGSTPTTPGSSPSPSAPACRALTVALKARGRLRAGTLIAALRLRRSRGHATLALTFTRAARLQVSERARGRTHRLGARSVLACHAYSVRLPVAHGAVTVTASVGRASEQRHLRA
jgi:hypothetical protein